MRNLVQTQIATYLAKSRKAIDEIVDKVTLEIDYFPQGQGQTVQPDLIRNILEAVIKMQQSSGLVGAETLFIQAGLIQDAEGDIGQGDISSYSETYCCNHKCPLRVQDGMDKQHDGQDEFYCGATTCENRSPTSDKVTSDKSREGHSGHLMEPSDIDKVTNYKPTDNVTSVQSDIADEVEKFMPPTDAQGDIRHGDIMNVLDAILHSGTAKTLSDYYAKNFKPYGFVPDVRQGDIKKADDTIRIVLKPDTEVVVVADFLSDLHKFLNSKGLGYSDIIHKVTLWGDIPKNDFRLDEHDAGAGGTG